MGLNHAAALHASLADKLYLYGGGATSALWGSIWEKIEVDVVFAQMSVSINILCICAIRRVFGECSERVKSPP